MYFPQQRYVSEMMRIRRRSLLPDTALGKVNVEQGQVVDVRDTIARGIIPQKHHIIEAADLLGLKRADSLPELLLVPLNRPVSKGTVIAGRDANRGKRILSPIDGLVVYVGEGRIIMQETPQIIKLEAGVRGQVVQVHGGRGVSIEATGGVVQGIWGNDHHVIATLRLEPEEGIESVTRDELDTVYRGEIIVTRNPLTPTGLEIGQIRNVAGIIAPSMDSSLMEAALSMNYAIMITGSFGHAPMIRLVQNIFETYDGYQAVLDAALPRRFDERRPELMVHRFVQGQTLQLTEGRPLEIGMTVRVTRSPYLGQVGKITDLPNTPTLLPNGLRVMVAQVELGLEENVDIPLANLELAGG
jgi:hypothetical protein